MKQLEVQIMGQSYLLGCPEGGEDRLRDAVGKVDTAMCKIRDAGKLKARDRIAVLASLNLAFELSQKEARSLPPAQQPALAPTPMPTPAPANTAAPATAVAAITPIGPSPAEMAAALQTQARIQDLVRRLDQALGLAPVR